MGNQRCGDICQNIPNEAQASWVINWLIDSKVVARSVWDSIAVLIARRRDPLLKGRMEGLKTD